MKNIRNEWGGGAWGDGGTVVNVGILVAAQGRATDISSGMSLGVAGSRVSVTAGWQRGSC